MAHTTVSAKFEVVIPKEIRLELSIRKGQRLQVVAKGDVISLVPERPVAELRGLLKGAPAPPADRVTACGSSAAIRRGRSTRPTRRSRR